MTRKLTVPLAILALLSLLLGMQVAVVSAGSREILEFESMVGVPAGLTGTQSPVRNINGGGVAWQIRKADGELNVGGHLELKVRGLVLLSTGSNPAASFRAVVSCLSNTGAVVNVSTDPFPATTGLAGQGGGNATVKADLALPQPCIAPIVFVTSATGSWFAATGG